VTALKSVDVITAPGCGPPARRRPGRRKLRALTAAFPDVAAAVAQACHVVLDGELVVWQGSPFDIAALQDRLHTGR